MVCSVQSAVRKIILAQDEAIEGKTKPPQQLPSLVKLMVSTQLELVTIIIATKPQTRRSNVPNLVQAIHSLCQIQDRADFRTGPTAWYSVTPKHNPSITTG